MMAGLSFRRMKTRGRGDSVSSYPTPKYARTVAILLAMGLGIYFPNLSFAQDNRMSQIANEVIEAALQNGTSLYTLEKEYQVRAGLHLPSAVADGESLIWGAIELYSVNGEPVQGAVVEIYATAGTIHLIDHPVTNENGHLIFALQSTLQPTSFRVRFNFPQFGIGGSLSGSFCRRGEPGCFLPRTCADFPASWEYYPNWDYYLVSGIGKIPKSDWNEYVSGRRKIFNI